MTDRTTFISARQPAPMSVLIVPVGGFALHALALCVDALRVANREALRTVFGWTIASEDSAAVVSSSGIEVPVEIGIEAVEFSPLTVLIASYHPEQACNERLLGWLRRQDRRRASIGCVDTGALILARAGIGAGAEMSVHPAALHGASEDYRDSRFTESPYTFDRRHFSCAGGLATADMMLALIEHYESKGLADRVAEVLNYNRGGVAATARPPSRALPADPALARCIELMQSHIEEPLSLTALGVGAGVPVWTLRRLFRRHLATTPAAYYMCLRLDRGRQLLAYSHLSVSQVAAACGFSDLASFSRAFARRFAVPPSQARHDETGLPVMPSS